MISTVSHSAVRFGGQPTQERKVPASQPENIHQIPPDSFSAHPSEPPPSYEASHHEALMKQLPQMIRRFIHHLTKLVQILTGQYKPEPEVKAALKDFSHAIQERLQSPRFAQESAKALLNTERAMIQVSDMPEEEKQRHLAALPEEISPEHAQAIASRTVANIFHGLSDAVRSEETEQGFLQVLNTFPEMITEMHAAQQTGATAQEKEQQTMRAYFTGLEAKHQATPGISNEERQKRSGKERQEFLVLKPEERQQHLTLFSRLSESERTRFLKNDTKKRTEIAKFTAEEQKKLDAIKAAEAKAS